MKVSDSILRLRRLLRDRDSHVFTNEVIVRIWNEIYLKFSAQSGILEGVMNLPVPPTSYTTYSQEWEEEFTAKPSSLVYNFLSPFTYTQPWEGVVEVNLTPQVTGGITCTHGWESHYESIQNRIKHHFPDDYLSSVYIAYDEKPIDWVYRKEVENGNTVFKTREGAYPSIYVDSVESMDFYLYPKVTSVYGLTDINGEYGELMYDSDGELTFNSDYGVSVYSSTDDMSSNYGAIVMYQESADAIHLIYKRKPREVTQTTDDIEIPKWCVKYVEFGVLGRLFSTNSDVFNQQLAGYFTSRYDFGLETTKLAISKMRGPRVYKREDLRGVGQSKRRLADLPSHYQSYWGNR